MRHKIPIGRTIALVIAVIFLILGILSFIKASGYYRKFYQWIKDEPIRIQVDLSKPGNYTGKFIQTCHIAHGLCLYVETQQKSASEDEALELVKGIKGSFAIIDSNGNNVLTGNFNDSHFATGRRSFSTYDLNDLDYSVRCDCPVKNVPFLSLFSSFCDGTYTFKLAIYDGAPALANTNHMLVARYSLCGLEILPGALLRLFGFTFIGISIIIIGVMAIITWRRKKRTAQTQSSLA